MARTTNTFVTIIGNCTAIALDLNLDRKSSFSVFFLFRLFLIGERGLFSKNISFLTIGSRRGELRGKSRTAGNFSGLILPAVRADYLQHPDSRYIDTLHHSRTPRGSSRSCHGFTTSASAGVLLCEQERKDYHRGYPRTQ